MKGVEVNTGKAVRLDLRLEIGDWGGCCEYAAGPMKTKDDYVDRIRPFTYSVGEAHDDATLRGLANLVYGDKKIWIQIYEASRDVVRNPNAFSYGISLTIPPSRQPTLKVETKVLPPNPSAAASQLRLTAPFVILAHLSLIAKTLTLPPTDIDGTFRS